jgi:stage IV sporulation protein FB
MQEVDETYYPPKPEIEEQSKTNINKSLLSLGLFILMFYFLIDDIQVLFLVVLILFIHEMGHFIAMKVFGYNGVNMFFIPLIGAMVTGEKDRISQSQRAIIVLAGPVPGVLIGCGIIAYAQTIGHTGAAVAGFMFLLINVLNLLPLDPLDGGKLIETLFFSSNEKIKQVFLIASVVSMVVAGVFFQMYLLAFLGLYMSLRIKMLKTLSELRKKISVYKIPLIRTYDELTDKEYWTIRKEYILSSKLNKMIDPNEYVESQFEDRIAISVRNVLITPIEKDISAAGKLFLLLLWAASLILPVLYALPYLAEIILKFS